MPAAMLECLEDASKLPPARDDLFEKAVELSSEEFDKVFEERVRSLDGFSVSAPTPDAASSSQK